jgi:hypothetical protein
MPTAVTSGGNIVARPVASMDASGEATYVTLNQVTVEVGYEDLYDVSLNQADSWKLINSFDISGVASTFTAVLSNSADFQEVLARKLAVAICETQSSPYTPSSVGKNLATAINDEMAQTFSLATNAVPNLLEEATFSNSVGWAGGAANMASLLVPIEVELLAQQIPEANYALYSDASGANFAGHLPLKNGDTVTFVFTVNHSLVTRLDSKTTGSELDTNAILPAQSPPVGPYGGDGQAASYLENSRSVAFRVTVTGSGEDGKIAA